MPRTTYDTEIVNEHIGKYHCFKRLGHGGMSIVYLARDTDGREVAVKVLHPHVDPKERERFRQEAGALAMLTHPGIVKIYDFGLQEFNSYVVTEYVPGVTVRERLDELIDHGEYMLISEVEHIFTALCDALRHAHSEGVAHLDIKPSNVILAKDDRIVLTDFGLAKIIGSPIRTATAAMFGTPAYGAPELAKTGEADARSDIYSLAVMLFEMLTNRLPFIAETPYKMIGKHVQEAMPAVSTVRPDLPSSLNAVLQKATEKEPGDRFQSIDQFVEALTAALNGQPIPHLITTERAEPPATITPAAEASKTEERPTAKPTARPRILVALRNRIVIAVTIIALFAIGLSALALPRPGPSRFIGRTIDQVALLERPDSQAAVIGQLSNETEVELLAQSEAWFQVRVVEGGQVGWLAAEKVAFTTPLDLPVFTSSRTSVYELPEITSRVVGELRQGTRVALLEQSGAWWRVRDIESDLMGWTLNENLVFVLPSPTSTQTNTLPPSSTPTPTPPFNTPTVSVIPSATPTKTARPTSAATATSTATGASTGDTPESGPTHTPTSVTPSPTPTKPSPTPTKPSPTPTKPSPTPTKPSPSPTNRSSTATWTPLPPTSTHTPVPPTATHTPVPPTSTYTSVPPTPTNTPRKPSDSTGTPGPIP